MNWLRIWNACVFSSCIAGFIFMFMLVETQAQEHDVDNSYRWMGYDFVFCFISDDGTKCNRGWVEKGMDDGFRFTMSVNAGRMDAGIGISAAEAVLFAKDGFEISNHSTSHAHAGMIKCYDGSEPPDCDPFFGDLRGYFDYTASFADSSESMPHYRNEICRGPLLEVLDNFPESDIQTFVYPGHGHNKMVVEDLYELGYLGARNGVRSTDTSNYETNAMNSWDEGISLFRVPLVAGTASFFGDHSADPPIHFTHREFVDATMPYVDRMRESGGIMAVTAHHYGDDDTCHSALWEYGYGGMTDTELGWMVDLVRNNNGIVMTFSDALKHYRVTAVEHEIDGDLVWVYSPESAVSEVAPEATVLLENYPNPFNPGITFSCVIPSEDIVTLMIFDLSGKKRRLLQKGNLSRGHHEVFWNGKDDQGKNVPSGTYLAVLQTDSEKSVSKVVLIR